MEERSAVGRCEVLVELDKAAQAFVQVGFNSLFTTVAYDITMENAAMEATDHSNFTALSSWFMRYHRLKEKGRIAALPKRPRPEMDKDTAKPSAHQQIARGNTGQDEIVATLSSTAEKLAAMMANGEHPKGGEDQIGEKDAHEEAPASGQGGVDDAQGTAEGSSARAPTEASDSHVVAVADELREVAEAEWAKWAALPSVLTWNLNSRKQASGTALVPAGAGVMGGQEQAALEHQADAGGDKAGGEEMEARTPDQPPDEPLDPYEFNAGQ